MKRLMLVTALGAVVVAASCTPVSETSTTSATPPTTAPVPTTDVIEPPIRTGIGVEDGVIRIGVMVPRSGPVAAFGEAVLTGQMAYWTDVNETLGGVGGEFQVEVTVFDHRYETDEALAGFDVLSDQVVGLAGALGSPIDEVLAVPLEANGMLMMAGSLTSEWVGHSALVPNLLLPTYRDQVMAGLAWAVATDPVAEAAILYQEGSYGEDCVRGYERAVSDLGLINAARVAHSLTSTDFGAVVGQLNTSEAEVVVVCTTPDALTRIIATADSLEFHPTWLVSAQSFDSSVAAALGGDDGVDAGLALLGQARVIGAGPPPEAPASKLRQAIIDVDDETNWYTFLGYSQAATFHLILEEALEASDLTREGLQAAAGRLDGLDLGLDGPLSSLVRPVPVAAAAVGVINAESIAAPFGVPASEPYFDSLFAIP